MIEALLELQFAGERAKDFSCASCHARVQKLRRCREDKFDFDDHDAPFWPIRIQQGGGLYSFCPGKATWDQETKAIYSAIVVCAETHTQWQNGGIADQPSWWIDLVSSFVPMYNEMKFYARAKAILGDSKAVNNGNIKRQLGSKNNRRK